jgi:hypothetical protein
MTRPIAPARAGLMMSAALALLPACAERIDNGLVCARGETVIYRSGSDSHWIPGRGRTWVDVRNSGGYTPAFDERCWTERQK